MEQSDKDLSGAIEVLEQLAAQRTHASVPLGVTLTMARALRETRRWIEGEIAERSQRHQEITGRLAALERRMSMREVEVKPVAGTGCYQDPEHGSPWCAVHDEVPDWSGEVIGWKGPPGWVCAKGGAVLDSREQALSVFTQNTSKIRDLEAQVSALQKAIDDVWALVEQTDGYGSPFWSEPGLDDTTPAQAVDAVLEHLREVVSTGVRAIMGAPAYPEAMAALNAADRQSDDDQICGC